MVYEASLPNDIAILAQDHIHIGTKARNRLLKRGIVLPMGIYKVSIDHLKTLINSTQKSVHGLTASDVFPTDRMNYDSFGKIVQERVLIALEQQVPNSNATIQYLRIFRDIVNGFLLFDLKPLERLLLIWRGIFLLRIWRRFLEKSRHYSVAENFITYNCYTCVELNGMTMIRLIQMFRDRKIPEQFLPGLFDSQVCERIFRTFRNFSSTKYTKINFPILDMIYMIGRIEVENDIKYCKLNVDGIELPHKRSAKTKFYELPMDDEIHNTISVAKDEAFEIAKSLGMTQFLSSSDEIEDYEFQSRLNFNNADEEPHEEEFGDDDCFENAPIKYENFEEHYKEHYENLSKNANQNINTEIDDLDPMSPLVYVIDENGEKKLIPKSTYLWMITEPGIKMSNDRIRRFKRRE